MKYTPLYHKHLELGAEADRAFKLGFVSISVYENVSNPEGEPAPG